MKSCSSSDCVALGERSMRKILILAVAVLGSFFWIVSNRDKDSTTFTPNHVTAKEMCQGMADLAKKTGGSVAKGYLPGCKKLVTDALLKKATNSNSK